MALGKYFARIAAFLAIVLTAVLAYGLFRYFPRTIPLALPSRLPLITVHSGSVGVVLPTQILMAQIGDYPATATSFLRLQWIRGRETVRGKRLMLCGSVREPAGRLRIYLQLQDDLLVDLPYLSSLVSNEIIPSFTLEKWTDRDLSRCEQQSFQIDHAFATVPERPLTDLPDRDLIGPMSDFLIFKSATDPRVLSQALTGPIVLNRAQARELAQDIIVVARFYALPLNYFLGIGAMENNYMSVRGDLDHAVWKKHAEHGDIVLQRRRGRVLVRNYSLGIWQLTRETLRYAQSLYLHDRFVRDYTLLPDQLRPAIFEDPDEIRPETITTYAGLLFRTLLDRFNGDIPQAVGAYNGGPGKPNPDYAAMVQNAAIYARRVIMNSAAFDASHSIPREPAPPEEPLAPLPPSTPPAPGLFPSQVGTARCTGCEWRNSPHTPLPASRNFAL